MFIRLAPDIKSHFFVCCPSVSRVILKFGAALSLKLFFSPFYSKLLVTLMIGFKTIFTILKNFEYFIKHSYRLLIFSFAIKVFQPSKPFLLSTNNNHVLLISLDKANF